MKNTNEIVLDEFVEKKPALFRYMLAFALAAVALGLRVALLPASSGAKFTTFYPAVILAFYLGGNGPGVATIVLTALATLYFFLPPYHAFAPSPEALQQTVLYLVATGFCGYFVNRMHRYRRSSIEAQKELSKKETDQAARNLSLAIDGARLGVWQYDPDNRIVSISDKFAEHFGLPLGVHGVSYEKIIDIIHPDDRAEVDASLARTIATGVDFIVEHRVIWPDGSERWIYGHGRPFFSPNGDLLQLDGVSIDMTERKQSQIKYLASTATIRAAFSSMKEAIIIVDTGGNLIDMNYAVGPFLRFKGDEQPPRTYASFIKHLEMHTSDGQIVTDDINPYKLALKGISGTYDMKFQRRDTGETWYGNVSAGPILDADDKIVGAVVTGMDITERMELQRNLEEKVRQRTKELLSANRALVEISRHDALTGLHNRLAANERLRSEFERMKRTNQAYGVLMLDIDHFKNVNDSCGHATGDEVLKMVADAMSGHLREYDFIARWGGEEFLVLLPATDLEQAGAAAEKLRAAVAAKAHPLAGAVTVSAGVCIASPHDLDEDNAVMHADSCLYEAKQNGRNRIVAKALHSQRVQKFG